MANQFKIGDVISLNGTTEPTFVVYNLNDNYVQCLYVDKDKNLKFTAADLHVDCFMKIS